MPNDIPDIPDFEIIRPIGEGGFGRVWLARNATTGRLRAVKLIPLARGSRTDAAGREIASLTRLEKNTPVVHPNLLKIDHVGRTDEYLFYVMDPADDADGSKASDNLAYRTATLQHLLEDGPLTPEECLAYARAILSGLGALHAQGMVHRDVKPANCLFVGGILKLADFGLLTAADAYTSRVGTETYMPPDGRMDTRADVYAAGLVIYEMLTGQPADNFPQLGARARDISNNPQLQKLNHLALRACRHDPQDRFADAQEMLDALEISLSENTARPSVHGLSPRRIAVVAGMAAIAILSVAFFLTHEQAPSQNVPQDDTQAKHTETITIRFISTPENALILLDDNLLLGPDGHPLTTPCTAENIPPRRHHVIFRRFGLPDHDAGVVDFAKRREVRARWD